MSLKEKIELVLRERGPLTVTELNKYFHTSKSKIEKILRDGEKFFQTINQFWDIVGRLRDRTLLKLMSNYCWDYSFTSNEEDILDTLCQEGKVEFESAYDDDSYESKLYYLSDDYVHELCSKHTQCCSVCRDYGCCDNTNDDQHFCCDSYLKLKNAHSKHCRCEKCDQKRVDNLVNKKIQENKIKQQTETSNSLLSLREKQRTLNKLINKMRELHNIEISWESIPYDVDGVGRLTFLPPDYSKTRIYNGAGGSGKTLYVGDIDQCIKYVEANMDRKEFIENMKTQVSSIFNIDVKKLVQSIKDRTDMYFGTTLIPSKILIDFLNGIEDLDMELSKEIISALVIDLSSHFKEKE